MRKTPFLLLLLLMVTIADGQSDTLRKYLDGSLHLTTKHKALYYALAIKEGFHWALVAARPDTSLLLKIFFANPALTVKDGYYSVYYPGGKIQQEGFFVNDIAEGRWQSWYDNGQVQDSGQVTAYQCTGLWKRWYKNGQLMNVQEYILHPPPVAVMDDKDNNTGSVVGYREISGVLDGPNKSWYADGLPESAGVFQNDTMTGVWKWFRENGQPSSVETYTNGKVTGLECYNEKGEYTGATCSIMKEPVFIHPFFNGAEYISYQLQQSHDPQLPEQFAVLIEFTVDKTGMVTNLHIKNCYSTRLQLALWEIIHKMPPWSPAVRHNQFVDRPIKINVASSPDN